MFQRRPRKFVGSNGAGDTFMVAIWHGLELGLELTEALTFEAKAVESGELVPGDSREVR